MPGGKQSAFGGAEQSSSSAPLSLLTRSRHTHLRAGEETKPVKLQTTFIRADLGSAADGHATADGS